MDKWKEIKTEYVTTDISYRQLAEKYSVSMRQITEHGRLEHWVAERERFRHKSATKAIQKATEIESNRLAKCMTATGRVIDVAMAALEDNEQFNRYLVERKQRYAAPLVEGDPDDPDNCKFVSENAWTEEITSRKVDAKALKDMLSVIKDCTALMRDFYNIPTPAQSEAQRIAAARLEMDKAKANPTSGDDNVYGVVLMPPITPLIPPEVPDEQ